MKIYTKTGDDGMTGLLGNVRVPKHTLRLEAYGCVDETNSALGVVLSELPLSANAHAGLLAGIQEDLFSVGTMLATPPQDTKKRADLPTERIAQLERAIDRMEEALPPLKTFIMPGGHPAAAMTHLARSICRRAERAVVALKQEERVDAVIITYLNRLSDFLFVLARWINRHESRVEKPWINPLSKPGENAPEAAGPDRMTISLQKLEEQKRQRQSLFERASSELQKKKEQAQKGFEEKIQEINKDGGKIEKDVRDIDLD